MSGRSLSIRASLLGIIGFLNLLLAVIAAYNTVQAVSTLRNAGVYREATTLTNNLFSFANSLSLERGSAMAAIYADPAEYPQQLADSRRNRAEAEAALGAALQTIDARSDLKDLRTAAGEAKKKLAALRERLDAAPAPPRDPVMADEMLAAYNDYLDSIDRISTRYSGTALADNPSGARRLRFARAVWSIAEYSGRQYALLGRIIAENKYPSETQQRDLLVWQGRIEYAWDLAYSYLDTTDWGAAQRPFLDEANTQFGMTFEQVKSIFTYRPSQAAPAYPITAEMWLDMAAQGQDSLHKLTESAIQLNRYYIDEQERSARQGIVLNLFLLLCAVVLSLYSWHVIERRVLTPIREMVETMYRAARGDAYELLPVYNADEIGKLGEALRIFQENARQLAVERDRANSANIAKSEFLASMSHEIRTPMNVVLGITSILQMGELSDKQKQLLDTQQRSGEALLALLNDLLDVSKIETHGFQLEQIPFRLDKLIGDVIAVLSIKAREKGLPLDARVSGVAGRSYIGDPTRLKQILTNLCGNAIKFTARGQVLVSARATQGDMR
ncbi:MAG TPA: histidine kinase dimerization/phospho-acceptor domain-containing protein, partial [Patescibacteria group bacterium]|nr:histidine kinase dimerization/phospho-acceptor domain-containing protein [Patescibacteria group bacterium]